MKDVEKKSNYRYIAAAVFIACLLVAAVIIIGCGKRGDSAVEINPGLALNRLTFNMPQNAASRFDRLVNQTGLAKHFKNAGRDGQPWIGRVRQSEVSYQALFTVDDCGIAFNGEVNGAKGLNFSVFHPSDTARTYRITIANGGEERRVFEQSFKSKTFYDGYIPFDTDLAGDVAITFSTLGRGVGAWVNPRFHRVNDKPRIYVLMVLDTLRYDHTSVYGYHRKTTPFLEQLAADGVTYGHAFSSTSWTLPAHVSLFSGKDLSEHGVLGPQDMIPGDLPLVAELFQREGFVTAAFTGGGFVEDSYGFYRGFQYYSNAPGNVFSMNSAERVLNHFKDYIKRFRGEDLFIFLHTYQIHAPYKAPRPYIDRIDKNVTGNLLGITNYLKQKQEYYGPLEENDRKRLIDLYDASILYTDEILLGGVIGYLKEKGAYEQSMVAVLSDHGEEFYDHGSWEHGHTLYNELIKIPLVVKFPFSGKNKERRGAVENGLTSITDVPGLLLSQTGFEYGGEMFKVDIGKPERTLPVLFPVSPIIKEFPAKFSFVDQRYHFIYTQWDRESMAFFKPPPQKTPAYELYQRSDPKETRNLYKEKFRQVNEFKKPLKKILDKLKRLKRKGKKLDKDLEKKLKSLGYLN
jgi:arylsulfatase A-like enzyme